MRKICLFSFILLGLVAFLAFGNGTEDDAKGEVAEPIAFEIVSHRVHQKIVTEGPGGDFAATWIAGNDDVESINWNTLQIDPIHDRLFREASLPETEIGVAYITYAIPRVGNLLEPLDDYLEEFPIEGFEENFSKGQLDAVTFDGKLYGIPVRSATASLGYNQAIFDERGIAGPPTTPEEFYETAKQCTFKRADGSQVYGYLLQYHYYTAIASIAAMWGGQLIDSDFNVVCDEEPMVKAVALVRQMYLEGLLAPGGRSLMHAEKQRLLQQNMGAMTFDVVGKVYSYNAEAIDPVDLRVAVPPVDPALSGTFKNGGPARTEFWLMVIPKNSKYKEQAWDYIRALSNHDGALAMALNGNGTARASVFSDPAYAENDPGAEVSMAIVKDARVALPAFDKTPQARELVDNYIETAMLGEMTPQAAMDELASKLKALSSALK